MSILKKRQLTEKVGVGTLTSPSSVEDTEYVDVEETVEEGLPSCSVSSANLKMLSCSTMNTCKSKSSSSGDKQDVRKKKKMKQNQQTQLSLTSFFCKIPSNSSKTENLTKSDADNHETTLNSSDCSKETLVTINPESNFDDGASQEHSTPIDCSNGSDKKTMALMEWQRIQQLMQDSIPLCEGHREACVARVVKKPGPNFGRRFYVCARGEVIFYFLVAFVCFFSIIYAVTSLQKYFHFKPTRYTLEQICFVVILRLFCLFFFFSLRTHFYETLFPGQMNTTISKCASNLNRAQHQILKRDVISFDGLELNRSRKNDIRSTIHC